MRDRLNKRDSGFSLLEMTVSLALGGIVLAAAVQIYVQGVAATWTTTQRAELQQDFRSASNILTRDLSLAGAGLGNGAAIALPSGVTPVYGCSGTGGSQTTATCYIISTANPSGAVAYPTVSGSAYLYGLLPGYNDGPTLTGSSGPTDSVTTVYTDSNFYLDCYTAKMTSTTTVTFTLPTPVAPATGDANCTSPTGNAGAQAVNDSAVGLTPGDLVLFTFGLNNVVAEVTTAPTGGGIATFATGDVLKMNQASTVANSLASMYAAPSNSVTGYATRVFVITYYIDNYTSTTPRLMQQVNGHTPVPIAENVVYAKYTYDLFNTATDLPAVGCSNPGAASDGCSGASTGMLPNQITKINIQNLAMNSTLMGTQFGQGNGYQRMDLQTSVCARNLTYVNNYPN
ncbi:MAG TPA: prepilin-type N-terminal cleavage/methylation domain-containing protein [Terriglobales bacterium]|jgi:prepilin-type N-terminal cleavage/methylation domain-containing protein|nr:prepilin-type N-terminal cleavage/methylation domain-containing protein [Terriglobales bacterium]